MTRHVKLTVTGTATMLNPRVMRVCYQTPDGSKATVAALIDSADVTVEDVTAPRTWTDGDVVASSYVWVRDDGRWWVPNRATGGGVADEAIDKLLADAELRATVLRYQAGDQ